MLVESVCMLKGMATCGYVAITDLLNMQTKRDAFPMPLINVLFQMGSTEWFSALDLQFGFWQIRMSPYDIKNITIITKSGLYDWNVC